MLFLKKNLLGLTKVEHMDVKVDTGGGMKLIVLTVMTINLNVFKAGGEVLKTHRGFIHRLRHQWLLVMVASHNPLYVADTCYVVIMFSSSACWRTLMV